MPIGHRAIGRRHMVSAGNALAARAADQVLEAGGNAVDAGVAGGLALGVVQSDYVNIAGVAPIMIRQPDGTAVTIDGLGAWPAAVTPDLFMREHGGEIPLGILRTVVPAAPSAWIEALSRFGTMTFAEVAAPAIRLAREGFAVHWLLHNMIASHEAEYAKWPSNAAIYLPGGRVPRIGERFVQSDLAATLQNMADCESAAPGDRRAGLAAARAAFYQGDIARQIVDFHAREGGLLTAADLAGHRSEVARPLPARFAGGTVLCCGAFCQGPFLGLVMQLLDRMDWSDVVQGSATYFHRVVECVKLAFADREAVLGDPAFVDVPVARLLSPEYAAERLALFDPRRAAPDMPAAGVGTVGPVRVSEAVPAPGDTSYIAVVDASGLAISATPSDVSYESPVVPGTGLVPSSRGSASWADPAHPSSVAPGKRPRLTPNPAIWVDAEGRSMPLGTPGGDVQIQAMAQVLLNRVIYGMDLEEAVLAPRVASYSFPNSFAPHESHPGLVRAESRIPAAELVALKALGHRVDMWGDWTHLAGAVCAVAMRPDGALEGAADPRRPTGTAGV
ncbi:gamma-glutamyltransferase family protein [Acuticoccus sp. I52.16.1]|uniref:gamma-glutamyltransferase family protein n=1 Tax=Acuticoccus sp. I52.16.1 TaxID=2928472 RepID=UPI001FD1C8E7|nr:gamma-glutamyltransferase [Acuticoccus sp. I52.16.1]UOM33295.1 gamma-glutamyltransferase family protein [Acuticoccus sp. I52.16.1]